MKSIVQSRLSATAVRCAVLTPVVLAFLFAIGCGESSNEVSISGRVSYRGEPVPKAAVAFFPTIGPSKIASTSLQGEYSTALEPGDYTVTINVGVEVPPGYKEGEPLPPPKIQLPPEYTIRTRSKLTASVKEGQSEPIDFKLE